MKNGAKRKYMHVSPTEKIARAVLVHVLTRFEVGIMDELIAAKHATSIFDCL